MRCARVKKDINEKVRKNDAAIMEIAETMGKSYGRVRGWFYDNSVMLTHYTVLTIIANHLKVSIEDLLEPELQEA